MANLYYDGSRGGFYSQEAANSIFTGAMTRLYGWIALGVVTTGAVGWISHQAGILESILENFGMIGYFIVLGVWLACIFGLSFAANRVPPAVAGGFYLVFTAITGVMISYIFWAYTGDTIILAFALTTGVFAVMSVIGYTTKRDLSGLGTMCFVGLIGVVIAGVVNWFIGSSMLSWIITLVALPIFLGLTVYQTKQVKELAMEAAARGDERAANQVAIMGAVGLYLAFLNIFLILLRIMDIFGGD
jgi:FtsH-binding integral membrane protein